MKILSAGCGSEKPAASEYSFILRSGNKRPLSSGRLSLRVDSFVCFPVGVPQTGRHPYGWASVHGWQASPTLIHHVLSLAVGQSQGSRQGREKANSQRKDLAGGSRTASSVCHGHLVRHQHETKTSNP